MPTIETPRGSKLDLSPQVFFFWEPFFHDRPKNGAHDLEKMM
jgi:hypothetical protein